MVTAHDCKTESSLLFCLDERCVGWAGGGLGFPLDATEFFCICEDEVHVLVKREHLSRHLSAIIQRHSHPIVDEVLHLALLGRHDGPEKARTQRLLPSKDQRIE